MIIAQEILHSMEKKKGRNGTMALKITLKRRLIALSGVLSRKSLSTSIFPQISLPSSWIVFRQPLYLCSSMMVSSLLSAHLEVSVKETSYRPTYSLCALNSLGSLSMIKNNSWKPIKASGPAQPSPIYFLPTTWCSSAKLVSRTVRKLMKC